mmetsp:Transcript_19797/g.36525  ORF Transcript_19797/g.36525 Transcript_19797/m.36525 type:complete len:281 (-) Transcript_19797:2120-2962(-)
MLPQDIYVDAPQLSLPLTQPSRPPPATDLYIEAADPALRLSLKLQTNLRAVSNQHRHQYCKGQGHHELNRSEADLLNEKIVAARSALSKGQLIKVQRILEPEIDRGVRHADVYYLLGEVKRLQKRPGEALEYLLHCIGMRVHTPYALYSLGLIYAETDRFDKAISLLRTFLSQVETASAHYELANCLIKCGEAKEAIVHLTRSIELNRPDEKANLVAYILRADLYESIGYQQSAQQDYLRVLQIDPSYHLPYLEHAEELEAAGQLKEALAVRTFISKLFS